MFLRCKIDKEIGHSSYEAMFGCPAKIGLASTNVENVLKNQNENTKELEIKGDGSGEQENSDIIGI